MDEEKEWAAWAYGKSSNFGAIAGTYYGYGNTKEAAISDLNGTMAKQNVSRMTGVHVVRFAYKTG